jgi:hypothetical protein
MGVDENTYAVLACRSVHCNRKRRWSIRNLRIEAGCCDLRQRNNDTAPRLMQVGVESAACRRRAVAIKKEL